jgi:type IV pilus assembly protein PilM
MSGSTLRKTLEHYFPVPTYLSFPSVGIDVSPFAVRFMEILPSKKHFVVGRYAHERLKSEFKIGHPESMEEARKILLKWKKMYDLKFVEISLPEEKAYLFKINIPYDTDTNMRASIEFNLEENVPLNPTEAIFDYRIISPTSDGNVSVAVTVLPIETVNEYVKFFESTEIIPISFLIEAQALAKAIITKNDKGTYFIINISENKTGLFVVSEGSVQFTSTLQMGGQNFTAALMRDLNISKEEAENVKKTKGLARTNENKEVFSALISTASALVEEIEKIYVYWHTHQEKENQNQNSQTKKILLCGKDSLMPGFKEYMNQSLRMEAEIANVWTNVASFEDYIPPISAHEAIDFGRAIGLALPKIN